MAEWVDWVELVNVEESVAKDEGFGVKVC